MPDFRIRIMNSSPHLTADGVTPLRTKLPASGNSSLIADGIADRVVDGLGNGRDRYEPATLSHHCGQPVAPVPARYGPAAAYEVQQMVSGS